VTVASPAGGPCPVDAGSMADGFFTEHCKKFMHDPEAVGALSHSVPIADVDMPTVDALYIAGGHGCCNSQFYNSGPLITAIEVSSSHRARVPRHCARASAKRKRRTALERAQRGIAVLR
jgi:hypothetical protein